MKFRTLIEQNAGAASAPAPAAAPAPVEQTTERASKRRKKNTYMPEPDFVQRRNPNRPNPITQEFVEAYESVCGNASARQCMDWLQNQKEQRYSGKRY